MDRLQEDSNGLQLRVVLENQKTEKTCYSPRKRTIAWFLGTLLKAVPLTITGVNFSISQDKLAW